MLNYEIKILCTGFNNSNNNNNNIKKERKKKLLYFLEVTYNNSLTFIYK
jgi:hypothetical protein